jgi:hypothetical protein
MCKLLNNLSADPALIDKRLFPVQLPPLRRLEEFQGQLPSTFSTNRRHSANCLYVHSILMGYRERQILTKGLVFASGPRDE